MSWNVPLVPLGCLLSKSEEYAEIDPEKRYRHLTVKLWGKGVELREEVDGISITASRMVVVKAKQFILSKIDARNGAFGLIPASLNGAIVSADFPVFTPDSERLLPEFLDWMSKTPEFVNLCAAASEGTTHRIRLKMDRFLAAQIPLPLIEEQRRIVARIEELAAKIEEARGLRGKVAEEANNLINAALLDIFTRGAKRGWHAGKIGDYVVHDCYGTSEKTHDDPSGTPILRMGNIQDGRLYTRDLKYLYLSDKEREKLLLTSGDILVNRTNSAELVGKCAVFDLEGDYAFASYLIRLRLDKDRADPVLVAAYINSPLGREYMFNERKQMTGQANVNSLKLKALPIALPPLPEQRRIVAHLDALQARIDALKREQAGAAAELDALLPSILDKAFKGEL